MIDPWPRATMPAATAVPRGRCPDCAQGVTCLSSRRRTWDVLDFRVCVGARFFVDGRRHPEPRIHATMVWDFWDGWRSFPEMMREPSPGAS